MKVIFQLLGTSVFLVLSLFFYLDDASFSKLINIGNHILKIFYAREKKCSWDFLLANLSSARIEGILAVRLVGTL